MTVGMGLETLYRLPDRKAARLSYLFMIMMHVLVPIVGLMMMDNGVGVHTRLLAGVVGFLVESWIVLFGINELR